ncbi:Na/Pi cotransporter family protein [Pseudomonadota bacterium]
MKSNGPDLSYVRHPVINVKGLIIAGAAAVLLAVYTLPVIAASAAGSPDLDWFGLGMGLFGGLAMFLFGMEQMSGGLQAAAGDTLKDLLARLTRNRVMGAITGAIVTAVLNSSSVTTVLVVGFISAGFMSLSQSVGVIMGANIGSTFTAQIIAFNVTQYALIMVALGFFLTFTAKQEKTGHYGSMVMGLGLIFYGMGVMGDAMTPLRSYEPFLDLMVRMENPLLGILVGAVFTGLVQSSAATTGIAIVMAAEGLITLPAGIALAFGSNIGTCVTALLAAMGKPVEAVRAAVVHILFNIAGVLIWVLFIPYLADFIVTISPSAPDLAGKEKLAAEVPRQIANAHTVFNVANTILFIGFTGFFARLAEKLVPDRVVDEKVIIEPKYLNEDLLEYPAMALEAARFEIGRMGGIVREMMDLLDPAFRDGDLVKFRAVRAMDDKVDILQEAILNYMGRMRQEPFTENQSSEFQALMSAAINMESIADVVETDVVAIGEGFIERGIRPSEETGILLKDIGDMLVAAIDDLITAVREHDETAALKVISIRHDMRRFAEDFIVRQSQRIAGREGAQIDLVRLEMELLDSMRRIYTLAKRVAREFVPREVGADAV